MGFNISGPSNQPIIQSSQSLGKDGGGGGNTGFMNMRGGKKKKSKEKEEDNSVFLEEEIEDKFVRKNSNKQSEKEQKSEKFINALTKFIKKPKGNSKNSDVFVKEDALNSESDYFENKAKEYKYTDFSKSKTDFSDDEYEIVDDNMDYNITDDNIGEIPDIDEDDGYYDNIDV